MKQKLEALTGLRFFAAAAIVIFHIGMKDVLAANPWTSGLLLYQGVTFFYVLSGFILRYNYSTLDSGIAKLEFLVARIARIYPAYIFFLLLCIFSQPWLITQLKSSPGLDRFVLSAFMLQSWVPIWETHFSFNAVNWSVSTEFFFYICFALFIGANPQKTGQYLLIFAGVILAIMVFCNWGKVTTAWKRAPNTITNLGLLVIFPPARLFEFLLGVMLADCRNWGQQFLQVRKPILMTLIELAALILLYCNMRYTPDIYRLIFPWAPVEFHEYYNTVSSLPGILAVIYIFSLEGGGLSKLLGGSVTVYLGEISYSIYLCHTLVAAHVKVIWSSTTSFVQQQLLIWLIIILLSSVAYFCIERPMRKLIVGWFKSAFRSKIKEPI